MNLTMESFDQVLSEVLLVDPAAEIPEVMQSRKKNFKKGPCMKQLKNIIQKYEENELDLLDESLYKEVLQALEDMPESEFQNLKNQLIQNYEQVAEQNKNQVQPISKNKINPIYQIPIIKNEETQKEINEENSLEIAQTNVEDDEEKKINWFDRIKQSILSDEDL